MRYLCDTYDLLNDEIKSIIKKAIFLKENFKKAKEIRVFDHLKDLNVGSIFYQPSLRTRVSCLMACRRLNLNYFEMNPVHLSLAKKETLEDTLINLSLNGVDLVFIRSPFIIKQEFLKNIKGLKGLKYIGAGNGTKYHPTQTLTDLMTIQENIKDLDDLDDLHNLTVLFLGDIDDSRVFSSNFSLMNKKFGVNIIVVIPEENSVKADRLKNRYLLENNCVIYNNLELALKNKIDIIYSLRGNNIALNETDDFSIYSVNEFIYKYQLNKKRLDFVSQYNKDIKVMHAGPINWGIEFDKDISNDPRLLVDKQVENKVWIIMALLCIFFKE